MESNRWADRQRGCTATRLFRTIRPTRCEPTGLEKRRILAHSLGRLGRPDDQALRAVLRERTMARIASSDSVVGSPLRTRGAALNAWP